jgi:hypothetical protein
VEIVRLEVTDAIEVERKEKELPVGSAGMAESHRGRNFTAS